MDRSDIYSGTFLIKKLIELLEHPMADNFDRRKEYLDNYLSISPYGFIIWDLCYIITILDHCSQNINDDPVYREFIEKILMYCSLPPVTTKSTEVLTYSKDLNEYFSCIACLLVTVTNTDLRDLAIVALHNLLTYSSKMRWQISLSHRLGAAEKSCLSTIITRVLLLIDDELYSKMLNMIYLLIEHGGENCAGILQEDALNSMILRLSPHWKTRRPVDNLTEISNIQHVILFDEAFVILWKLLQYLEDHPNIKESVPIIRRSSLWSIQDVLYYYSLISINATARNSVVSLILRVLMNFPQMEFVASGLAKDIAMISIYSSEYRSENWTQNIKLIPGDADRTCVQLVTTCLQFYNLTGGGIKVLEHVGSMNLLLKNIRKYKKTHLWSLALDCVFIILTLNVIRTLIPAMEEDFIEFGGVVTYLNCIKRLDINSDDVNVICTTLECLLIILRKESRQLILKSVIYNDGIPLFLNLTEKILECPVLCNLKQSSLKSLLCLTTTLKPFTEYSEQILKIYFKYVNRVLNPGPTDAVFDNNVMVCLIDLIWEGIVSSKDFAKQFANIKNLYILLDLLETSPLYVQIVILGLLTDLLQDLICVPYLLTWKTKNGTTFITLLLEIFRGENKRLQVRTGHKGQIECVECPLMGLRQLKNTYYRDSVYSSPSLIDMFMSSRPKIYAILTLLYERYDDEVQLIKEQYKLNNQLSSEDQVTLLIAENFMAIKLGELWEELRSGFEDISFVPIPMDKLLMNGLVERYHKWMKHLKKIQNVILREEARRNISNEENLFQNLNDSRLAEALASLSELKYVSKCSERMFRVTQKYRQNKSIFLRMQQIVCPNLLTTFSEDVTFSTVFNQIISVWFISPEESKLGYQLVSPTESDNEIEIDDNPAGDYLSDDTERVNDCCLTEFL